MRCLPFYTIICNICKFHIFVSILLSLLLHSFKSYSWSPISSLHISISFIGCIHHGRFRYETFFSFIMFIFSPFSTNSSLLYITCIEEQCFVLLSFTCIMYCHSTFIYILSSSHHYSTYHCKDNSIEPVNSISLNSIDYYLDTIPYFDHG